GDRAALAGWPGCGPGRGDASRKGRTKAGDAKARDEKSGPEWDEPDPPREDRDEPDRDRRSNRVRPPTPEIRPDPGGNPEPGHGRGSSGHDTGGPGHPGREAGQGPTPGMTIPAPAQGP